MKKLGASFRWIVLAASLILLAEEFVRVSGYVIHEWGILAELLDGAIWYKLGEGLVLVPFLIFLFFPGSSESRMRFASRSRWVMWAGAVVCAGAWFALRWRVVWSWWCLALLILGLLLPVWMRRQAIRPSRWRPVVLGASLLALFALHMGISYLTTGYFLAPLPAAPPPPAADRAERWRQDLRYLASELPRLHANAYHTTSRSEYQAAVDALDQQIPALSDAAVTAGLMRLVAQVGDAHTALMPGGFHQYPLHMRWFKDGLFVVETTPAARQALGARVIGIGAVDIETAYRQVSALISHENESTLLEQSPTYLATPEILQSLGILPDGETGRFVFAGSDGRPFSLDIAEIEDSRQGASLVRSDVGKRADRPEWISAVVKTPLYRQKQGQSFWFQILPEAKLLYFKYNLCNPFGFDRFNRQLWQAADANHIEKLVVDLRGNPGGSDMQFESFVRELKKRPLLNQKGRLYVFVDGGTFSSAVLNAVSLRQNTEAVFYGAMAGSNPNGYGEVRWLRLRNSGLTVSYATQYIHPVPEPAPPVFLPDQVIEPTAAEYFAGQDPLLQSVLDRSAK